jgi:Bacterial PH domain
MTQTFPITPASNSALWVLGLLTLLLLGLVALFSSLAYSAKHVSFEVSPEGLRIRGDVYGRFVPAASLVAEQAKEVNLTLDSAHRPAWRTNGTGLPGYQAGWFRLVDGEKALLFLTDRTRAVYVPTRSGYSLLLSPAEPQAFIATLQQATSTP